MKFWQYGNVYFYQNLEKLNFPSADFLLVGFVVVVSVGLFVCWCVLLFVLHKLEVAFESSTSVTPMISRGRWLTHIWRQKCLWRTIPHYLQPCHLFLPLAGTSLFCSSRQLMSCFAMTVPWHPRPAPPEKSVKGDMQLWIRCYEILSSWEITLIKMEHGTLILVVSLRQIPKVKTTVCATMYDPDWVVFQPAPVLSVTFT